MREFTLIENMLNYCGQTVTIFTTSGGISGAGFTGVLVGVSCDTIKLIVTLGPAPDCACGSACGCPCTCGPFRMSVNGCGGCNSNFVGAIAEIPVDKVVSFVHNAI